MKMRNMLLTLAGCMLIVGLCFTRYTAAQDSPQRIEISSKRFQFAPAEITLKKGEPAILVFKSEDVTHGLHLPELNIEIKIPKGSSSEVSVTPEQAGDFVGHCAVFCGPDHGHMALTIHVAE